MENYAHAIYGAMLAIVIIGITIVILVAQDTIKSNKEWDKTHKKEIK